jgi:hypothetical protein
MTRWCSSSSCSRRCLTTSPSRSPSPLPPSDPRGDSHRCRLLEARRPQRRPPPSRRCIPAGAYSCCTARPTGGGGTTDARATSDLRQVTTAETFFPDKSISKVAPVVQYRGFSGKDSTLG